METFQKLDPFFNFSPCEEFWSAPTRTHFSCSSALLHLWVCRLLEKRKFLCFFSHSGFETFPRSQCPEILWNVLLRERSTISLLEISVLKYGFNLGMTAEFFSNLQVPVLWFVMNDLSNLALYDRITTDFYEKHWCKRILSVTRSVEFSSNWTCFFRKLLRNYNFELTNHRFEQRACQGLKRILTCNLQTHFWSLRSANFRSSNWIKRCSG